MADATPTAAAAEIEKPGYFYLGQEYDLDNKAVLPNKPIMYDVRDLTTHGVVVGMTGSGKTGLCISLLEEAALNGIPCVMIDPKGDLTNILLQFPDLDPRQFQEWIDEGDARQKGLSQEEYAVQMADRWRKGLAETNQPLERIAQAEGEIGLAHLHARERIRTAAVHSGHVRGPQGRPTAGGKGAKRRRRSPARS